MGVTSQWYVFMGVGGFVVLILPWRHGSISTQVHTDPGWLRAASLHHSVRGGGNDATLHFQGGGCNWEHLVMGVTGSGLWVWHYILCTQDIDFFQHLEMYMRAELPNLVGRDHMSFRSYYMPVKVSVAIRCQHCLLVGVSFYRV